MPATVQGQVGMDEEILENPELEALLEKRAKAADSRSAVQAKYKKADDAARAELDKLDIPSDSAVRIGRFRITKKDVPARHVDFDTDAGTRLSIAGDETGEKA